MWNDQINVDMEKQMTLKGMYCVHPTEHTVQGFSKCRSQKAEYQSKIWVLMKQDALAEQKLRWLRVLADFSQNNYFI